jgi:hypothetical protein
MTVSARSSAPTPAKIGEPFCRRCGAPTEILSFPNVSLDRFDPKTGRPLAPPKEVFWLRCTRLRGFQRPGLETAGHTNRQVG